MANREVPTTNGNSLLWAVQCLSALPASFLAALGALVLYGRARLGGWPVAHINDPYDIGVSYMIFYLLTLGLLAGTLVWVVFVPHRGSKMRPLRSMIFWSALAFVLWTLAVFVVKCDPGGYVEWLYD